MASCTLDINDLQPVFTMVNDNGNCSVNALTTKIVSGDNLYVNNSMNVNGNTLFLGNITYASRAYQEIYPGSTISSLNGYYGLAKDAYPSVDPESTGAKAVSAWTSRAGNPDSNNWNGVCWAPGFGLFCAVATSGSNDRVMTSPDGITWTSRATNTNEWTSVCWSPELRIACAVSQTSVSSPALQQVMTSSDGIAWNLQSTPGDQAAQFDSVCWATELGLFCAVARSSALSTNSLARVMTSPNGTTWTLRNAAAASSWENVIWVAEIGLFVACASAGDVDKRMMASPDGVRWALVNPQFTGTTSYQWRALAWSPQLNLLVASNINATGGRIATSPDGINWTLRTTPTPSMDLEWVSGIWVPHLRLFVFVSQSNNTTAIMSSPDGVTWTLRTTPGGFTFQSICWSSEDSLLVAVSNSGTNRVLTSSLKGQLPTANTVFNSPFNRIDSLGNWTIRSVLKAGTYVEGTAAPSVAGVNYMVISNSSATAISSFGGGVTGQVLTLYFPSTATQNTSVSGTNIRLVTSPFTAAAGQNHTLRLIFNGTNWLELSRAVGMSA